jgi:hypothetical protein
VALAIDASTPAFASSNTGATVTTASFTPPAGAVLVAVAFHDTASGNLTNTSIVTGGGLTWTIRATRNRADAGGQNAHVQVSTAVVGSSAAMTITTTGTNCLGPVGLYMFVMTGADTTTPFDDIDEGSNTSGVVSLALSTVTDQAWAFLAVTDWNVAAAMTAGASQTAVLSTGIGPGPDVRIFIGRQNAVTSPAGAVTMSTGSPSSGNTNNFIAWAVKPAAAGGGSVSGTAVAALGGLTATAAGTPTTFGTAASALGSLTATAAGTPTTFGAAASTLGALTATAAGTRTVLGVAVAPLGQLAAAAVGGRQTTGTAAALLGALTATAVGGRQATGTAASALGALTATAVGTATTPVAGTAAALLGALTATAAGTVTTGVVATRTLADGPRLKGVTPLDSTRGTPSMRRRR